MDQSIKDFMIYITFFSILVIALLEIKRDITMSAAFVSNLYANLSICAKSTSTQTNAGFEFHKFIRKPPNYQCSNYPRGDRHFGLGNELLKKFGGDKEKALDYLYEEMALNREHSMHSMESLITLEQLLISFDMYVRCNIYYQPAHFIQMQNMADWPNIVSEIEKKYKLKLYSSEVFHYDHRMKEARPKVKEYVRNRDIIDLGTYIGDSVLALLNYTDKKIYSYEFSPRNFKISQETIRKYIPEGKVHLFHKGINDERKTIKVQVNEGDAATRVNEGTTGEDIEMTTIDYEAKLNNLKVGLIKGDVEGYELKALHGAKEVLKRDRPVVTLSLYHHLEEFFGVPRLLREMDYEVEYYFNSYLYPPGISEFVIFAYPSELL